MDVFALVRDYVERLIPADSTMKCLLLDPETVETVSVVFGQSHLLERGVFLIDQVTQTDRTAVYAMRCIVFVRPSIGSIRAIEAELKAGNFQSYTLGFSNAISSELLNRLASADVHERVVRVEECFADFTAINRDLVLTPLSRPPPGSFDLPVPSPLTPNALGMTEAYYSRVTQGITAACLALRRRPLFRFAASSQLSRRIATECIAQMRSDPELYNFQAKDTVLLIVDRVDDVLTPLLTPWTYQAMLAEHLDMHNNRLLLPGAEGQPIEERAFVFGQQDDTFFANNMYSSWGDVCLRVNAFVAQTKERTSTEGKSMAELRDMAQQLAVNAHMKGTAQKHINCMTQMAEGIKQRCLYQSSAFEQRMLIESSASDHWTELQEIAKKIQANIQAAGAAAYPPGARFAPGHMDIVRLCLIYHLKYEKSVANSKVVEFVARLGIQEFDGIVQQLRNYIGEARDCKSCLGNASAMASVGSALSSLIKGFTDVQSVRTQHEPLLKKHLVALAQNKLDAEQFPYASTAPTNPQFRPKEVVIFIAGGCTMEEASLVAQLQSQAATGAVSPTGDMKILLMAPNVLTTKTFIQALACARP